MNTRLQVEHGITESRYGVDLVEEQIAVAFGAKLRLTEENTKPSHFAMQVRINCEDPQNNFAPNSGLITRYVSPGGPGVRIDSTFPPGTSSPRTTTPPVRFSSPMAATGRKCSASWTAP